MKERSLLDIMEQMDDGFIAEAENPEILLAAQRKRRRMMLVKRVSGVAACALVAISVVLVIPMFRLMSRVEADSDVSMESNIGDALISVQLNSAVADMGVLEDSAEDKVDQEESKAEAESALNEVEMSQSAAEASQKVLEAEKAAEASEAAAEASKAAAEASKAAAEATKASSSATTNTTTTEIAEESEIIPLPECERIGPIEFYYSDHVLISLSVDSGYRLTSLIIPSEIGGEQITSFGDDFWSFCVTNPNLEQVTIPDMVMSFGDVSYLSKSVEVICSRGSAAEIFFYVNGYTVKHP